MIEGNIKEKLIYLAQMIEESDEVEHVPATHQIFIDARGGVELKAALLQLARECEESIRQQVQEIRTPPQPKTRTFYKAILVDSQQTTSTLQDNLNDGYEIINSEASNNGILFLLGREVQLED